MKTFKAYMLTEGSSTGATDMEQYIVIAFNGGYDKAPDTFGVKKERYEASRKIAENIAEDIRSKIKVPPNSMIHFGKGNGKMISWWEGSGTPKTDLYSSRGNANISLKQQGGSQVMSGLAGETRSTFRASVKYMGDKAPGDVEKLINDLESVLTKIMVQGNINNIAAAVKSKIIPQRQDIKTTSGKDITVVIDKKKYEEEMKQFVDWKKKMKELQPFFQNYFQTNKEFAKYFVYEAATGETKFSPDKFAYANWVVEFDSKTGTKNKINSLSDGKGIPSAYCESLANKVKIRISPKTPTGSKVTTQGMGSSSGSFRLDIRENFATFMENETKVFTESLLLTEENLDEITLFGKIKNWFKEIFVKVWGKVKALVKKGLEYVLDFFEYEPKIVRTSGLELFGFK
jgi:hypothetical protein